MELVQLHTRLAPRSHSRNEYDIAANSMYPLLGAKPLVLIDFCFTIVALGDALLMLLLGTLLFSRRVRKRNVSLINLLAVTILASVPPALL